MRYISLFSGVEAATLAWEPLGWEPVAFCEIEPFQSAVLAYHWPDVPNLGDITKVDWSPYRGAVDIVVGGSPCQSFSIAGGRESLGGESRLMFEYIRAVDEIHPRWILWENVPGVFSVKDGAFDQLITSLQDIGYVSLAWRVLDAQFFGVAQRRRRVFLVGRLGAGGGASAVLFESESVSGNTQTSKEKRKALAADAGRCSAGSGGGVTAFAQNTRDEVRVQGDGTISGALAAQPGMKQQTYVAECLAPWDVQSKRVFAEGSCAPTLQSGTHEAQNIQPVVMASTHSHTEIGEGGVSPTLTAHNSKDAPVLATGKTCSQHSAPQTAASSSSTTNRSTGDGSCSTRDWSGPDAICMADDNARAAVDEDLSGSLKVGGGYAVRCVSSNGDDVIGALCARDYKGVGSQFVGEGKVIACRTEKSSGSYQGSRQRGV